MRTAIRRSLAALALLVAARTGIAQPAVPLSSAVIKPTLLADGDKLVAGKPFRLALVADIQAGWHVNSHKPKEDYLIPTEASIENGDGTAGLAFSTPVYPAHHERKFAFSDSPLAVYEGKTAIRIDGTVDEKAVAGPRTIVATLGYQPCNDAQCLAPTKIQATLTIDVAPPGTPVTARNGDLFGGAGGTGSAPASKAGDAGAVSPPGSGDLAASALRERFKVKGVPTLVFLDGDGKEVGNRVLGFEPPESFLAYTKGVKSAEAAGDLFAGKSLPLILAIVFLSGLALNLTPCVYPLIPITIGFFSKQGSGKTFPLAALYVLGMSVTYSALGVFAALSGSLFGSWLQKPAVLVGVSAVVLALALSMFGLFEIQAPHFITDRTGSKSGGLGALTMGLFVGFVAAPCIGPFVLSLLTYVAAKGSALLGFGLFFTLAMGLGVPYLVLGMASGSLKKLPRSGEWMVAIKKLFGFALVALAVHFLRPLLSDRVYDLGVAAPLLAGGVYFLFFEKSGHALAWFRGLKIAFALALFATGAVFALPEKSKSELVFEKFSDSALEAARAQKKPVMIDFYADWCIPCKELDHKTFNDPRVVEAMKGWVLLKVDLTKG